MRFVDILVRQAHPGPGVGPYHLFEQKALDADAYRQAEGIPWPVLVDDLAGSIHQTYGGLADPTYLIDIDGNVAFYIHFTNAPMLHRALEALFARAGRGIVLGGVDRTPHLAAAMTDGWRGLQRGLPQSFIDLETAMPGAASGAWLGYQFKPLLAPLTLRSRPLPPVTKGALAVVGLTAGAVMLRRAMRRHPSSSPR